MKRMCVVVLAVLLMGLNLYSIENTVSQRTWNVLSESPRLIELGMRAVEPTFADIQTGLGSFKQITMPGAESSSAAGKPELPVYGGLVAIPPNAAYRVFCTYDGVRVYPNAVPNPVSNVDERGEIMDTAVYQGSSAYPQNMLLSSNDAYIRDFRVVQFEVYPLSYDPVSRSITQYQNIRVNIELSYPNGELPQTYPTYSSAFAKTYEAGIINFASYRSVVMAPQNAKVLIIHGQNTDPTFILKLAEFVAWKRQKGFEVAVASTSVAGTSTTAIKNYIQTQYNNIETRPDYIILIGDVSGSYTVPTFYETISSYNGEGDYPYTHLSGNDYLGDAFIGRISAENLSQLTNLLAKGYTYEKTVNNTGTAASWLNRMLIIGDPSTSGISCVYVGKYIRELAEYANPAYSFIENYTGGYSSTMNSGINQGVGFFCYRGYYGMSSWSPSSALTNGFKVPHAVIMTCGTGSFGNTATTEALVRLGTEAVPAGSVTAIGMATTGTHTGFNNVLTAGIMNGVFTHNMRTMGEALLHGRLYLYSVYGSSNPNQASYFAHWCNLMGDPTLEAWVGIPQSITIDTPVSIPVGTTVMDVHVQNAQGEGEANVTVTAYSSNLNVVVAKAFTGADGLATLNLPGNLSSGILITASKHDTKPVQANVSIDGAGSIVYSSKQIIDDGSLGSSGNADGFANATETIAMLIEVKNSTPDAIGALTGQVTCDDPQITIQQGSISIPAIDPGQTAFISAPVLFGIDANISAQHDLFFTVELSDGTTPYSFQFHAGAYNARVQAVNYMVNDMGNGVLDPGESSALGIQIYNSSVYNATDLYGELRSLNDLIVVTDSLSYFGNLMPGTMTTSVDGFAVLARNLLIPGMQMPLRLRVYNSTGFEQTSIINVSIGTVTQNTPLGPDEYGYMIYDVTDTAYPDCPTYQWIEINPSQGGPGTLITGFSDSGNSGNEGDQNGAVTLQTVNLPFAFPFYGVEYNQITVCVNGFIAMGATGDGNFRNARLPGGEGPSPMIAAFWDDLAMGGGSGIYRYYDANEHIFIVQYHNLKNGYNLSSEETFQVIFYDPLFHPTGMGDGMIKIQYKVFNNVDVGGGGYSPRHGNYSTIGIKDHSNTRGLEYSYNNQYPAAAAPLSNQKAILITTVPVLHQTAHIVIGELIVNDQNQNGIMEPGESAELGVKLNNLGLDDATSVNISVSTTSSHATISQPESAYYNIPGSSSGVNTHPIVIAISPDCPADAVIPLVCHISIANNAWTYPVTLTVRKPMLQLAGYYVNDTAGNGNGMVEPGESFKVIVNVTNNSLVDASDITFNVMCLSEYVNISNPEQLLSDVPALKTRQVVYDVTLAEGASMGSFLTFYLTYLGAQISPTNEQFLLSVGTTGMDADFENNNGSFVANPATNAWQWGTSTSPTAHSGTKLWGTLLGQQYPNNVNWRLTSPSIYVGSNFVLEFWHYYDMEATYDGGNIKISTNNGGTWNLLTPESGYTHTNVAALAGPGFSGNSGWSLVRCNLSAYANQNVMFMWTFASDTMIQGQGWFIDDVKTTGFVSFAGCVSGTVLSDDQSFQANKTSISSSGGVLTRPVDDGFYELYLPLGTHVVTASAPGYLEQQSGNLLLSNATANLNQDFLLFHFAPVTALQHSFTEDVMQLSWEAPQDTHFPVTGYKVMKRLNAGRFEPVANVPEPVYTEALSLVGAYQYYVVVLYANGESIASPIYSFEFPIVGSDDPTAPPLVTRLHANYPNPFNPSTTIGFDLAKAGRADLSVYNIKGQKVKTLCLGELNAGRHSFVWNGRDEHNRSVASGIYFYRLSYPGYAKTMKMMLMK